MGKRSNFERREAISTRRQGSGAAADSVPARRPDLCRALLRRRRSGPASGSFWPALWLCRRYRTGQDALALDHYGAADAIITNPPYTREVMHRLIAHFQRIAPTWLLLDFGWAATRQAAPFLPHCSDIVAIGRVKWIEGSKHTGKDNHAWYRFDARHRAALSFTGATRARLFPLRRTGVCEQCRKTYEPQRSSSRFCSQTCRQRAHRNRLSVTSSVTPAASESSEEFRYVRHADVPRFTAEGWELLPALDGTHHGEYSALMRRRV